MAKQKYNQGNGFFVVRDSTEAYHIPIREVSHLKSGNENRAIVVLKSGKEIPTQHWMNKAKEMLVEAINKSIDKSHHCNCDMMIPIKPIESKPPTFPKDKCQDCGGDVKEIKDGRVILEECNMCGSHRPIRVSKKEDLE